MKTKILLLDNPKKRRMAIAAIITLEFILFYLVTTASH